MAPKKEIAFEWWGPETAQLVATTISAERIAAAEELEAILEVAAEISAFHPQEQPEDEALAEFRAASDEVRNDWERRGKALGKRNAESLAVGRRHHEAAIRLVALRQRS